MAEKVTLNNSSSQQESKTAKTKLCWNCEGSVSRVAENCPYCGVYLSPDNPSIKETPSPQPHKPPYAPESNRKEKEIPKAPYAPRDSNEPQAVTEKTAALQKTDSFKAIYIPLLLLTAGTVCLFFSFILLLFSTNGKLNLEWDSSYWFAYSLIALPLLYLGWRTLDRLSE